MAFDADSSLGVSWGHLALGLGAVLILAALLLAAVRRRRKLSPWLSWLVLAAIAAALWTCLSVGAPVKVSGAYCEMNPFGEASDRTVTWGGGDCDRALLRWLVVSAGPSVVLLGMVAAAVMRGGRLSRRHTPSDQL